MKKATDSSDGENWFSKGDRRGPVASEQKEQDPAQATGEAATLQSEQKTEIPPPPEEEAQGQARAAAKAE